MINRECIEEENKEKGFKERNSWKPWQWSWKTLLLWLILAGLIRIVFSVIAGVN